MSEKPERFSASNHLTISENIKIQKFYHHDNISLMFKSSEYNLIFELQHAFTIFIGFLQLILLKNKS